MVLELIISGTTLGLSESMGISLPFTKAMLFPIQSSIFLEPRDTVTFFSLDSQLTFPPNASTIALIGNKVLLFLIIGGESKNLGSPLTVKREFPIQRTIINFFSKLASMI